MILVIIIVNFCEILLYLSCDIEKKDEILRPHSLKKEVIDN